MSAAEIDAYLAELPEPQRGTLEAVRRTILEVIPDAEQCIAYGIPGFRVRGTVVAGFAANASFLSYYPHSGSVLASLAEETAGYGRTKSALHFAFNEPLPQELVERLVAVRLEQLPD